MRTKAARSRVMALLASSQPPRSDGGGGARRPPLGAAPAAGLRYVQGPGGLSARGDDMSDPDSHSLVRRPTRGPPRRRRRSEAAGIPRLSADARRPPSYDAARQELVSRAAKLAYPIRDGIPIMLPEEARRLDD